MKKIRYAVVGAGWISQEAFMPSIAQTGNCEMKAIVTGNQDNARKLAEFHGIQHVFGYAQYDDMLRSGIVDAVYIALPNSMHADYAIRAARAGVHALVEKPLAISIEECEAMIAAADKAGVHLMTAYRLHNEPCTIEAMEMIRAGEIGDPRYFQSSFSYQMPEKNHRLRAEHWGGPLQDIGIYCLNAARHVFRSEPIEAMAMIGSGAGDARFAEVEEMMSVTLRFPGDRIASFTAGFGAAPIDAYTVMGAKGRIDMSPGFRFDTEIRMRMTKDGKVTEKALTCDHFSGQAAYFADCIIKGEPPESDGGEGLADVRAMLAIEAAAKTGRAQAIHAPPRPAYITKTLERHFPATTRRLVL